MLRYATQRAVSKTLYMRRTKVAALLVILAALAACGGDDDDTTALPDPKTASGSQPTTTGTPEHADLAVRWWNWAASAPEETNPVADTDGSDCAGNQPSDVWFLADTFGSTVERICAVPAGQPLFAPVVAEVCSPDARCVIEDADLTATLGGEPLDIFSLTNPLFSITGDPANPVTLDAGPAEVVSSGFWVSFGPLGPGSHEVVLAGSQADGFESQVTYTLVVE